MYLRVHVLASLWNKGTQVHSVLCQHGPSQTKRYLLLYVLHRSLSLEFYVYACRYVKTFPFTNKNQQKEMIETKVVKEEKANESNPNDEAKKTENKPEEPKSPPKTTVRCLEAEV